MCAGDMMPHRVPDKTDFGKRQEEGGLVFIP
jgi:hypothetical protein